MSEPKDSKPPWLDPRVLVMAALFLVGGAGTGGATSLLGDHGVRDEVAALTVKVDALTSKLDAALKDDTADQRTLDFLRQQINDHETRIRDLEKGR